MDELESLFTIDRCGSEDKFKEVTKSKKDNNKKECNMKEYNKKDKSNTILYKCDTKLLEMKPETIKPQIHKTQIPKHINKRIHEAINDEKKCNPGKLSENLRKALGLTKYGLPMHIYKMRYLGYPPGWLRQIESRPSELKFIGDDSKCSSKNCIEYRTEDLIEYPGFNTLINYDPEEDNWQKLGMIAMQKEHSLDIYSQLLKNKQIEFSTRIQNNEAIDVLEKERQLILSQIIDIDQDN